MLLSGRCTLFINITDSSGSQSFLVALPPREACSVCRAEEQRLRRLVSLTKAPCNDFYEFVCGRLERELKASASWSPVAQSTLVADSIERRMLLFLQDRGDTTWAHHYAWRTCVEGHGSLSENRAINVQLPSRGNKQRLLQPSRDPTVRSWLSLSYR
ncbi:uncharacterized protein LOC144120346 [Amblyomma americanum]